MKLHNMTEEELLQLVNSNDTLLELKFKAQIELNKRESRRVFLRGTLVAWFAIIISFSSLCVSIISLVSKNSKSNSETQVVPDSKRVSPAKIETTN